MIKAAIGVHDGALARTWLMGLILIAIVLVATAGFTYYNLHSIWAARDKAVSARQIVDAIGDLQKQLLNAELQQRDFLISGDPARLDHFQDAVSSARKALDALVQRADVEPALHDELPRFDAATIADLDALAKTTAVRNTGGFAEASRQSQSANDEAGSIARSLAETLLADEQRVLAERRDTSNQNYGIAVIGCWLSGIGGLAALIAFGLMTRRQLQFQREVFQALHSQKERLHVTLASIGDAVITTDAECKVTYLNEIAESLTGWKMLEAEGQSLEKVFHIINENTRATVGSPASRALAEGRIVGLANHTLLIARDGVERPIEDSASPIRGVDGEIIGAVLVFRDVSERAIDERALRSANERMHLALEAGAIVGTLVWDVPAARMTMDAQLSAALSTGSAPLEQGLPVDQYLGLIHPDDLDHVKRLIAEAMQTGVAFRAEYRLRLREEMRWVEGSGRVEFDAFGTPIRFPGVIVDITERRRAERQLALAQQAGQIGTFEWQADSPIIVVSEEYCRLWGLPYQERIPIEELAARVYPEDRHQLVSARLGDDNPLRHAEFRITRADDGATRWIARRGQRVNLDENSVPLYAGVIFDVTERKRAEEERKTLNETLDLRVRERTRELEDQIEQRERAEEQLRQAQKMEAVGQLTGGLAHDFNNLLTGISASLEMLKSRAVQDRKEDFGRYLDIATEATKRAAALTHRLLAFSRRQPLDAKPTNVAQLITSMQDLLQHILGPAIELQISTPGEQWMTLCDPHQLESALLNLAINSRDAMPNGGRLMIENINQLADTRAGIADLITIKVSDNGEGMSPDVLRHAFEPFFTTKPLGEGTGLGLSMIHGFVNQTGGNIELESKPGTGTAVIISLPRYLGVSDAMPKAIMAVTATPKPSHHKVLVVDDEEPIRVLVSEFLSDEGHTVLSAEDARSALKLVEQHADIDLLITDIGLPGGLNGRQLANAFLEKHPLKRVLLITGYAGNAGIDSSLLGPRFQVLAKPFSFDHLTMKVLSLFENE